MIEGYNRKVIESAISSAIVTKECLQRSIGFAKTSRPKLENTQTQFDKKRFKTELENAERSLTGILSAIDLCEVLLSEDRAKIELIKATVNELDQISEEIRHDIRI